MKPQLANAVFSKGPCAARRLYWKEGLGWTGPRAGEVKEQPTSGAGSKGSARSPSRDTHLGDLRMAAKQASREGPRHFNACPTGLSIAPQLTVDPAAHGEE